MLTFNELRIGNIVIDPSKRLAKVEILSGVCGLHLSSYHHYVDSLSDSVDYEHCSGVDLTADVLTKVGFSRCTCRGWKGPIHLDKELSYNSTPPKKYLHELQNLVFALTGSELDTLKLDIVE